MNPGIDEPGTPVLWPPWNAGQLRVEEIHMAQAGRGCCSGHLTIQKFLRSPSLLPPVGDQQPQADDHRPQED
jgi:hypothetical protein